MVPCHSLQWSWCQLRSHLAAPTKVGVSPALSSGFSRWCQVVTVMESQPPCKTELLLLRAYGALWHSNPHGGFGIWSEPPAPPAVTPCTPTSTWKPLGRRLDAPALPDPAVPAPGEVRGDLDELFGCLGCPSPSSPPVRGAVPSARPQPGAPVAFSIHYSSSWKSRQHEAIRAGGAGAGEQRHLWAPVTAADRRPWG